MRLLLYLATKSSQQKIYCELKGLQQKKRGNFLDKNKKAAGFMLRPLINRELSTSVSFSLKFRK
jgi:hypothetical protein